MNIAMLSYHTCPLATLGGKDTGGMNVYVAELTRHLGKLGIHVDVFTRSQDEHVPHVLHNLGYGNRVVHIPAGPQVPLPKQVLVDHIPTFVDRIVQFSKEKQIPYDLIHSHYWMSGLAAESLKSRWNVPFVHMFHTLVRMKNRTAVDASQMEGNYRLEGENRVLHSADRIVTATPAEQAQLEFLYNAPSRKITIVPPGVDLSRFYPIPKDEAKAVIDIPPRERLLLFVGRIEPLKGIDTLIRAVALMQMTHSLECCPHYLAIIGGDPEETDQQVNKEMVRLQTLAHELGVRDLVLFLGKRDQETLPYYYSAADAVVMPSHYESFGMVALEAMACGTPVVASQVGGLAYLVRDGETGYFVPDGEPEKLADRLTRLLLEPEISQNFSQKAVEIAQEYSWDKISHQILRLYEKTLDQYDKG
jgi:D-inositol-3-phosphate glycosyltransferase